MVSKTIVGSSSLSGPAKCDIGVIGSVPAFQADGVGSSPTCRSSIGEWPKWLRHLSDTQKIISSSLISPTICLDSLVGQGSGLKIHPS